MANVSTEALPPRRTPLPALSSEYCKLAETVNNTWRATVPKGTPRERLLESSMWATVAERFTPFDKIIAVSADRSFYSELLVLENGRGWANVVELNYHPLPCLVVDQAGLPPNHVIEHGGVDDLYLVRRVSDGVILQKGFESRQHALEFLLEHASLR